MKNVLVVVLALLASLCCFSPAVAEDTSSAASELKALVSKVQDKLHDGKRTETELAPELTEFDALLDKHKSEKTDETAQIVLMKAMLYLEVLDNTEKGTALVQQLKQDYPETKAGKSADAILENIKQQEGAKKIQRALVEGAKFPDFDEKDLDGKSLSVANFKGKVVLVDFWATWCGPCVMELPNVIKAYEKHHDKGFEIIGISLDQDQEKLKSFIKQKNMGWQQYFDGKGWGNKLAQKYGVQSIPATFLLNQEGKIIGRDLRGDTALDQAVDKALGKN
jgi:thiol-disulfide isomerase/thioredoxin